MALPLAKRRHLLLKDEPITLADEAVFVELGVLDLHLQNEDGESVCLVEQLDLWGQGLSPATAGALQGPMHQRSCDDLDFE